MAYTVYLGELDRVVQESIKYLLDDNIDSLSIYEGLEVDYYEEDEEEEF